MRELLADRRIFVQLEQLLSLLADLQVEFGLQATLL
jgi:hypothetical protein